MARNAQLSLKGGTHVDIDIPELIATVATQLREANRRANEQIRKTKDDPFLLLGDIQLQIAFTAEESKTTEGHLELRPWVVSAGGGKTKNTRDAIVHTVTISLTPTLPGGSGETLEEKIRRAMEEGRIVAEGGIVRATVTDVEIPEDE
jgi:hypothetical protein